MRPVNVTPKDNRNRLSQQVVLEQVHNGSKPNWRNRAASN
jgi:hypothetical protein